MAVGIAISGLQEVQNSLKLAGQAVGKPSVMLKVYGEILKRSIQRNFDEGGRPVRWQPLALSTLQTLGKYRMKHGGARWAGLTREERGSAALSNKKILIDTGRLRRSIRAVVVNDTTLEIGTHDVPYAAIHQKGGMAGRGKRVRIPARPYLVIQEEDAFAMQTVTLQAMTSALRTGGGFR